MKPRKERVQGLGQRSFVPIDAATARSVRDEPSALDEPGKKTLVCEIVAGQHVYRRGVWRRVVSSRARGIMGWQMVLAPKTSGDLPSDVRCTRSASYYVKVK